MKNLDTLRFVSYIIVLVGGINWGLIGLLNLNIVSMIFGAGFLARLIYIIVGAAAGYLIYLYFVKKEPPTT